MSDMKPFVFDAALTDPLDIARRDNMEYFIDKILKHRGNLKKKTEIEFLVSWLERGNVALYRIICTCTLCAILNFPDVKCILVLLPHEHKC